MNDKYSFTILNDGTKFSKSCLTKYNNSNKTSIFEAYKKPSKDKIKSYYELVRKMNELNGYNLYITGAGSTQYSLGYIIKEDGIEYLIYETKCNSYKMRYI